MTRISERFGIAVRQLRLERRWSQIELAGRSDLDRSYVGEIERGEVVVSILTAEKIALAMEMDLSHLFIRCLQSDKHRTSHAESLLPIAR